MNKLMSIEEIKKDVLNSEYKSVGLFDKNGKKLIPFNSKSVSLNNRLDEIVKRLNSKGTPDDIYQIHAKHYGQNIEPSVYYVQKGELETLAEYPTETKTIEIIEKEPINQLPNPNSFITIQQHNDLYLENMRLQMENERLNNELDRLNDIVEELEENQQKPGMLADGTKEFLSTTMETLTPIIDKVLQQQDIKMKLRFMELEQNRPTPPQEMQNHPKQVQPQFNENGQLLDDENLTEEEELYIDAMENLRNNHPELYETAMQRMNDLNQDNE